MQRNASSAEVYTLYNQNFNEIRDWCFKRGYLFEDPYFRLDYKYEWRRPWQITSDPHLIIDGHSRFDVLQGELGDCWMLAAIVNLGMHPDLVKKVIPEDQSFTSQYAGIFHFRFWQFGKWFDVVIDDRLPTASGELVFTRSSSKSEFWSALLEKAYCKVIGGEYKAAEAGNLCEALEDFTGGVVEQFLLRCAPRNFQNFLLQSIERHSLVGCFIDNLPGTYQCETAEGLVRGHSYSVTGSKSVNYPENGSTVLVRLRNPWGRFEWTGPWSDSSPMWMKVPQIIKKELELIHADDGEFWMSYSDFKSRFQWVDMCHMSPDAFSNAQENTSKSSTWELNMIRGSWVIGVTAGGAKALHKNPQTRFTLIQADAGNKEGLCSVLIALTQKTFVRTVEDYNEIGFKVYQVKDPNYNQMDLDRDFFRKNNSVGNVPVKRVREVAGRFNFPPGAYCVISFTYEAEREGEFLVRIYSEVRTTTEQLGGTLGVTPDEVKLKDRLLIGAPTEVDEKSDKKLKEYFDSISGPAKKVDWEGLKKILDAEASNGVLSSAEKCSGWDHFLLNVFNSAYSKIFGPTLETNALKTIGPEGFSKDVCRCMVILLDVDHTGTLSYNEFKVLWKEIKKWKSIYEKYILKSKGYLNSTQLREAIEAAGIQLTNSIFGDIVHRYTTNDGKISFDDFLLCILKTKATSEFFNSKVTDDLRIAQFTMEEFMEKTVCC